jgi:amino acid transporter
MTSAFACQVALYNTAARYVFSMSRERLLPAKLAKVHPVHRTPQAANLLVGGLMLAYAVVFIIFDSSTLAQLTKTSTYGALMGVFALLIVQILCSVAIVRYFLTVARDGFQVGQTLIAPLLGGAGIVAAAYFLLKYRADLAGGEPLFIKAIPFVIAAVLIGGIVWALVLKQRNPDRYEQIGRYVEDEVDGEQVPRLDLSGEGAHRHQGGAA